MGVALLERSVLPKLQMIVITMNLWVGEKLGNVTLDTMHGRRYRGVYQIWLRP